MAKDMHFKEDTAKPENRTNLALFSILMVPEVKQFVCSRLGIPRDIIICPSPNLATEEFDLLQRPDFKIVKSIEDDDIYGYIEIELGREDEKQIEDYVAHGKKRVYSIVGKKSYREGTDGRGALSLEEILDLVTSIMDKYRHSQQFASLSLFAELVRYYVVEGNFTPSSKRAAISERMAATPLVASIKQHFGEERVRGVGSVQRGFVHIDTIRENGFSLKVYSTKSRSKGVSLMCRSAGRQFIEFPSLTKLRKYFPYSEQQVDAFVKTVADLGADEVRQLPEKGRARLPLEVVEQNIRKLARAIEAIITPLSKEV